jgi:triphosphoribosyl-dephospho-CoA synthase
MPDPLAERAARETHGERVRRAFVEACTLDVLARKAGNVSEASPGHRMHAGLFLQSAEAAAAPLCVPGASVGERIESAVRATRRVVQCNTNLGIVLLCAPIVVAQERRAIPGPSLPLAAAIRDVLETLAVDDASAAYRAIALARPAGLGAVPDQDVNDAPTVGLRVAMAMAAGRDRVARQYAEGYADVFDPGLASFERARDLARRRGDGARAAAIGAMQAAFLEFLGAWPDSHIARKHGDAAAHSVMAEARPWRERARRGDPLDADPAWAAWDESLKARGLNPGTSADLCVATALVAGLEAPPEGRDGGLGVSTQTIRHEI